jgi:hypothetical protein
MPYLKNQVYHVDALNALRDLPDQSLDAIVTDPVWPDFEVGIAGAAVATEIFEEASKHFRRLTDRVVVILGVDVDPRLLRCIGLPFVRVVWLRRVPASHRGIILRGADVGYVFGRRKLAVKGTRVLPGEWTNVSRGFRDPDHTHPCYRPLAHMMFLVEGYTTRGGKPVLDPFCGSGQTLVACKLLGREYLGFDIDCRWVDEARWRLGKVRSELGYAQGELGTDLGRTGGRRKAGSQPATPQTARRGSSGSA